MKYLFCVAFIASVLNGMDSPPSSSYKSLESYSAPNFTAPIKYTRNELLALGKSSLSRSMEAPILIAEIKVGARLLHAKSYSCLPNEIKEGADKTTFQIASKVYLSEKKTHPYWYHKRRAKK